MSMRTFATARSARPCVGALLSALLSIGTGCDQLPAPPQVDPAAAPQPSAPPPDAPPAPPPTPEQVISDVLATPPNLRTDAHLSRLAELEEGLAEITSLDLSASGVSNIGIEKLTEFPALVELDLSRSRISNAAAPHLAELATLESLALDHIPLDDAAVAELAALPSLRSLSLSGAAVSDQCFVHLARLEQLQTLRIGDNRQLLGTVFSEQVRDGEFSTLRQLAVDGTGFGYRGFEQLHRLDQLERLSASDAEVSDAVLDGLRSCRNLQTLILSNNKLTDAALARFAGLRELRELDLGGCVLISDAGLRRLRGLRQLERIGLDGTSCTLAGAAELKESLPEATIIVAGREL